MKIMFVCHGNICRSPMAEFILKSKIKEKGSLKTFEIHSCATSTEEIFCGVGNPVYPPAAAELRKHGLSCAGKRAVLLQRCDYNKYDMFICMDDNNIRNAVRIFGGDPMHKLSRLMDFTDTPGNVSDPWYTGDFVKTYSDIEKGCEALLTSLL